MTTAHDGNLHDPHLWLEEVEGDSALAWVAQQNAATQERFGARDTFAATQENILEVLDSDDKIAMVSQAGEYLYNFWRDTSNPRGLWRRTTRESYESATPQWDVLLDVDQLSLTEGEQWVFHGASLLRPTFDKALISLSRGGTDADETREFDMETRSFVTAENNGFFRAESKGDMTWISCDEVFVFTDFGTDAEGSSTLTDSGYPRIAKRLKRGQPLDEAVTVYSGTADDMYISAHHTFTPGFERNFVSRSIAFYNEETFVLNDDDSLTLIEVPRSAQSTVRKDLMYVELREDWAPDGRTFTAGSLLVTNFEEFLDGGRNFVELFVPTLTTSLAGIAWTQNYLVLNVMQDVKNVLTILEQPAQGYSDWDSIPFGGLPALGTTSVSAVDWLNNDDVWVVTSDYLTPTSLLRVDLNNVVASVSKGLEVELTPIKSMPEFFDSAEFVSEQYFAPSNDGTAVPYFVVRRKDLKFDGTSPTLLWGYGGFEISLTPSYSGALGRGWLERGGVYVVANIRGGGEYGPRWHQAALKEQRHKAYEDFSSVAKDLIERGITSAKHLGVEGRSNGGLLTGNMITQYPELFGAVIIGVPLLDMKRYSHLLAGASWMAEYGDPDVPEQWEYIKTFSPYHLFDETRSYPPVMFYTSTKDDRVHPGHARKLAARMIAAGKDVTYYENVEGGHAGSSNNSQAAYVATLSYEFLWENLSNAHA